MTQSIIVSRLLDKYENSKHAFESGASNRRVMLRIEKKELPEYRYEEASVRDEWNEVAKALEKAGLVSLKWLKDRPVLSEITLNLEQIDACYRLTGRTHPKEQALAVAQLIKERLDSVSTPWIVSWRNEICEKAESTFHLPSFCKKETDFLSNLLIALATFDSLHGNAVTMRTFSSMCYHDSKYFEREMRDKFLRIAQKYYPDLSEICEQQAMGTRDKLAFLGIYARPEIYELAGDFSLITPRGTVTVKALMPYGIALPSTAVDAISSFDLHNVKRVVFIENKTNYDEFILSEASESDLTIYHGGFLSPQKRKLVSICSQSVPAGVPIYFWADIDLGGFKMFEQLMQFIPDLKPMRMAEEDVIAHKSTGLSRSAEYLEEVRTALEKGKYPLFTNAMKCILKYGVTIEQEAFLSL